MRAGIFLASVLICFNSFADDYLLFEENGKYGVKDQQGKIIINAAFDGLGWSDGSFSVVGQTTGYKSNNRWGLINLKGERITTPSYLSLIPSGGDRFIVKKEVDAIRSKMGCVDLKGNVTIPLKYDGVKISGLRAIVFIKEGTRFLYGLTNLNGDIIIPIEYQNIYAIGDMRYAVQNRNGKYSLFSETGGQLTSFSIDSISSFVKNRAIIYEGVRQGLINREGLIEIAPQYREIRIEAEGKIKGRKINQWMVIDGENQILRTTECDELTPSSVGFFATVGNQQGVWDGEFNTIIPLTYSAVVNATDDRILVRNYRKFGLIDMNNNLVISFQFDSLTISTRFVRAKEKILGSDSWSLYDIYGIKKSERSYESIGPFNGRFFVVKNYGLSGVMDQYGKEIIHCLYDSLLQSNEDQLVVKFHGHYGIVDYRENWLLPPQPFPVVLVDEDHYLSLEHGTWLFKTFDGDLIYFTDNPIVAVPDQRLLSETLPDGTIKKISFDGITISRTSPPKVDDAEIISAEHEGLRGIKRNGKYGFVDTEGRLRIANRYEGIGDFHEGLAAVKILGKWGFVNQQDKIVINPSYESVTDFEAGIAIMKRGKMGLLKLNGEVALEPRYDRIEKMPTGNFLLYLSDRVGLASQTGEVLIDPRFDSLEDLGNGHVLVSRENKYGVLTQNGLSVIPMIYDHLTFLKGSGHFLAKAESPWVELIGN